MSVLESVLGNALPGGRRAIAEVPVTLQDRARRGGVTKDPQGKLDEFWRSFTTTSPGKVTNVIPKKSHAGRAIKRSTKEPTSSSSNPSISLPVPVGASYKEARAACKAKVAKIVGECRRINQKYRDPHFDLEPDLKKHRRFCLESLDNRAPRRREIINERSEDSDDEGPPSVRPPPPPPPMFREREGVPGSRFKPLSAKRVAEVFDEPRFFIEGATASDVRQGRDGDCWLMAALCTISYKPGLIEKICVARDEAVGVYGFVFYRDGEWFSEIIDDKLYLIKADYDDINPERVAWEDLDRTNSEETYQKAYQSNSSALYFAQCANPNETWLPLLEKAYAKAHGDYAALDGGHMGEGIEDLTGGIASEIFTTDILDKEYFWKEELMKVNDQFLFGCSTGMWRSGWGIRRGIMECHAYSVTRAVEIDSERLVLLKNPWGKGEWKGAWSDGSKEWTPEWLQKLGHRFGDDGAFWISYEDLLRKYSVFDRTRLFGADWKVATTWTTLDVPWMLEYHDTKFSFTLSRSGPVVIVLSQIDSRYFRGLEGQYLFKLSFRLHRGGEDDYLVRSRTSYYMNRSANVELDLEAGDYNVLVRIDATYREGILPPEKVVKDHAGFHREKLIRIGLEYDYAHAKGKIVETQEEKAARELYEKHRREKYRKTMTKKIQKEKEKRYRYRVRDHEKRKKKIERRKEKELEEFQRRRKGSEREDDERRENEAFEPSSNDSRSGDDEGPPARLESGESFATAKENTEEGSFSIGPQEITPATTSSESHGPAVPAAALNGPSSTLGPSTRAEGPRFPPPDAENNTSTAADLTSRRPWDIPSNIPGPGSELERDFFGPPPRRRTTMNVVPSRSGLDSHYQAPPDDFPLPRRTRMVNFSPDRLDPRGRMETTGPPEFNRPFNDYSPPDQFQRRGSFAPPRPMGPGGPGAPGGFPRDMDDRDDLRSISTLSDVSERLIEEHMAVYDQCHKRAESSPSPPPPPIFSSIDERDSDPWNAVATVGLRVYYKLAEEDKDEDVLKLCVVRPNPYELGHDDEDEDEVEGDENKDVDNDEEDEIDTEGEAKLSQASALDVDDAAKDAAVKGEENAVAAEDESKAAEAQG